MHEMSIAESTLQLIEEAARQQGFSRVKTVFLELGELSSIERDSLAFCFDVVTAGTVAAGARLDIQTIPGSGRCGNCAQAVVVHDLYAACPKCGSYRIEISGGTEMRVKELEVE